MTVEKNYQEGNVFTLAQVRPHFPFLILPRDPVVSPEHYKVLCLGLRSWIFFPRPSTGNGVLWLSLPVLLHISHLTGRQSNCFMQQLLHPDATQASCLWVSTAHIVAELRVQGKTSHHELN